MAKKVAEKVQEFKSWYTSKTIIGLIISSVSGVVYALTDGGVDIQGASTEVIAGAEELATGVDNTIASVMFFVGQAVAVWGRLKAKVGIK
jgi:hypothetical protein